jgi:hypothetical protein
VIAAEEINVANDVAYCRSCNLAHSLSELTHRAELEAGVDFSRPPAGTWRQSDGSGTVIGATHRSWGAALGTLAAALFWNGIVSIFVLIATASTLRLLDIKVPVWFPAPDGKDTNMGTGMIIFLWIFLTPFIVIGLGLIGAFLSSLAGRTEVRLNNHEGVVFTGIGPLGWRRRFAIQAVKDIRIEAGRWGESESDRRHKSVIVIETREGKELKFGGSLTSERRRFLAAAMRQTLHR